tara:strand:- start:6278 stop:6985 length:708 start_codon:yes stop_codon:yes gene_type:complete
MLQGVVLILLASSCKKILARWERGVREFSPVFLTTSLDSLRGKLVNIKPEFLLLDYNLPGLDGQKDILELIKLNVETKVVVFSPALLDEIEWGLFKAGIRGCCRDDIQPEQITFAIKAIQQGELWIRRTLTHYMLQELVDITQEKNRIEQAVNDLLANLTRREYEIARLIGRGESNKRIARQLAITERTVKAHLTEIFRKLDITDRLNLALIMKDTMASQISPQSNTFNAPPYFT